MGTPPINRAIKVLAAVLKTRYLAVPQRPYALMARSVSSLPCLLGWLCTTTMFDPASMHFYTLNNLKFLVYVFGLLVFALLSFKSYYMCG
jgi:hypothetical protein